jgi:hypothetical protein
VHDDPWISELRAAQHRLEPLDEHRITAPVLTQRHAHARGFGGLEVGDDVAAPERVDRLFGVADQNQRGAIGERPVDHLPLHGVGVLELVDHHDRPPLVHPQLSG